jgi:hypothetical protein
MHLEGIPRVRQSKQGRAFVPARLLAPLFGLLFLLPATVSGCAPDLLFDDQLTKNVRIELVDWHVSGLWVINSPVCWFRVYNYNPRPITDITINYETYDFDGKPLDKGSYTLLDAGEPTVVQANSPKSVVEQYIGIVSLESDKLSCKLKGVRAKE